MTLRSITADRALASGVTWAIVQMLLLAAVGIAAPRWPGHWQGKVRVSIGSAAFLYAAWTGLSGVFRLGRNRTPLPTPRADSTLITTGIYAHLRHPLYASMMAMGLGWACLWSSAAALGLAAVLALFLHAKARFEERLLRAKFADYASYAARVPRYFPRLSKPQRSLP